ncbi:homoserine kinase [Gottschalkiaceae bacterium SANA]|nr:homoserine kinase [Gottschalkiaceae bacterium SANA]
MFEVNVPYTTANLGPGFDCIGLALSAEARISVEWQEAGVTFHGCAKKYKNDNHLLLRAYRLGMETIGLPLRGLILDFLSMPPIARGLGSSAVCIVAGLMIAKEAAKEAGKEMDMEMMVGLATKMEGHPDNVAPALMGGCILSLMAEAQIVLQPIAVHESIGLMALIPPFELSTKISRGAIPEQVQHKQAVYNVGRGMLLTQALASGEMDKLAMALEDRLHEPYRFPLIKGAEEIREKMDELGAVRTVISGAGPTLLVVFEKNTGFEEKAEKWMQQAYEPWDVFPWTVQQHGAWVKNERK